MNSGIVFFPPEVKEIQLESTRYAGQLMLLYAAKFLGCIDAASIIDVTNDNSEYSNERIYLTNFLSIASGKQRLSHVDELIHKEFKAVCGGNYPQKSCNHAYLDKVVEEDQRLIEEGQESIIQGFMDNTTKGYLGAGILNGENLYMDKHVVELCTEKSIAKDQHALRNTVVKAINEYRVICSDTRTTVTSWFLNAGHSFSDLLKPAIDKVKSLTGKSVKLLGVDKGAYNYDKLTKAAEETGACIAIWSKDTQTTIESLVAVPEELFEVYETETIQYLTGEEEIVKTRIADAGEITIDKHGHKVRAVAIRNEETSRRIGILVFGRRCFEYNKYQIADFLYGKQDIENCFKERKKYGGDKFCGGIFKNREEKAVSQEELDKMGRKLKLLKNRIPRLKSDIEKYTELLSKGELGKRDYNRLAKKAQKDKERLEFEQKNLETKIESRDLNEKIRHTLDTRKITIVACIQDHVITCKRYILDKATGIMKELLSQKLNQLGYLSTDEIDIKVQKQLKSLNMQKISARLFEQGGCIYKDNITNEYVVIMKNYENSLMQGTYEKLCVEFANMEVMLESGKRHYRLVFMTESSFEEKYAIGSKVKVKIAV